MSAVTKEAKERAKVQARSKYWANKIELHLNVADAYRGPRERIADGVESEGIDARCPCCGQVYTVMDFRTDVVTGLLIEPTMCWRCG